MIHFIIDTRDIEQNHTHSWNVFTHTHRRYCLYIVQQVSFVVEKSWFDNTVYTRHTIMQRYKRSFLCGTTRVQWLYIRNCHTCIYQRCRQSIQTLSRYSPNKHYLQYKHQVQSSTTVRVRYYVQLRKLKAYVKFSFWGSNVRRPGFFHRHLAHISCRPGPRDTI